MYDGIWKDDSKTKYGTYKYSNGDIYIGEWKNDLRNGQGKLRYDNGD